MFNRKRNNYSPSHLKFSFWQNLSKIALQPNASGLWQRPWWCPCWKRAIPTTAWRCRAEHWSDCQIGMESKAFWRNVSKTVFLLTHFDMCAFPRSPNRACLGFKYSVEARPATPPTKWTTLFKENWTNSLFITLENIENGIEKKQQIIYPSIRRHPQCPSSSRILHPTKPLNFQNSAKILVAYLQCAAIEWLMVIRKVITKLIFLK